MRKFVKAGRRTTAEANDEKNGLDSYREEQRIARTERIDETRRKNDCGSKRLKEWTQEREREREEGQRIPRTGRNEERGRNNDCGTQRPREWTEERERTAETKD